MIEQPNVSSLAELAHQLYFAQDRPFRDNSPGQKKTKRILQISISVVILGSALLVIAAIVGASNPGWTSYGVLGLAALALGTSGIRMAVSHRTYVLLTKTTDVISLIGRVILSVIALLICLYNVYILFTLANDSNAIGTAVAGIAFQVLAACMAWAASDNSRSLLRADTGKSAGRFARHPVLILWAALMVLFLQCLIVANWLDQYAPIATAIVLVFAVPVLLGMSVHHREVRSRLTSLAGIFSEVHAAALANSTAKPAMVSRAALTSALARAQTEICIESSRRLFGLSVGQVIDAQIGQVFDWVACEIGGLQPTANNASRVEHELWDEWHSTYPVRAKASQELALFALELRTRTLSALRRY